MRQSDPAAGSDQAVYQIKVQGCLDKSWSDWFDGMAITVRNDDAHTVVTSLTGTIVDQAALYGVLSRIRDMGLPLLLVQHLE